jgi:hypothetical protein
MEDWDAWKLYPHHRWVYNKLELSLKLGYECGPAPMPVRKSGYYCVRPIMNLGGMAAQATIKYLEKDRILEIPPAHFWCERFLGSQYSVNFEWQESQFVPIHTSVGLTESNNLYRFKNWRRIPNKEIVLPEFVNKFKDVGFINIEFLEDKIIEIHLRLGEDFPEGSTEIIPVYEDTSKEFFSKLESQGYAWLGDYVDAEKNIPKARLGFYYK